MMYPIPMSEAFLISDLLPKLAVANSNPSRSGVQKISPLVHG